MQFIVHSFVLIFENDALQEAIREKMHRFSAVFRDPEHFSLKIVDFSASGTNRLLDVVGSVPELKIIVFLQSFIAIRVTCTLISIRSTPHAAADF